MHRVLHGPLREGREGSKLVGFTSLGSLPDGYSAFREFSKGLEDDLYNPVPRGALPQGRIFVAVEDERIIGAAWITSSDKESARFTAEIALIVAPDHRLKGIGSALLSTLIGYAKAGGLRKLWLRVYEDNIRAVKLYEKFGFKVEGRFERQEWDGDRPLTVLSMGLFL